jgi:RNA polymerase sigma-70 factor (ECF subfamily)
MHAPAEITTLLRLAREGDQQAEEQVFALVEEELRALAANMMLAERTGHTLQPTALVNEACLRLFDQRGDWDGREHFLALAATIMRRVLTDHARRHLAEKRGGGWGRVTLSGNEEDARPVELELLALDAALDKLAGLHERQARIVEMRYLAGMTVDDVSTALALSRSTKQAEWRMARAWLSRELGGARL